MNQESLGPARFSSFTGYAYAKLSRHCYLHAALHLNTLSAFLRASRRYAVQNSNRFLTSNFSEVGQLEITN